MHRRVDGTLPPQELHDARTEWTMLIMYALTVMIAMQAI